MEKECASGFKGTKGDEICHNHMVFTWEGKYKWNTLYLKEKKRQSALCKHLNTSKLFK